MAARFVASRANRDTPPSPLAGEGWGEGYNTAPSTATEHRSPDVAVNPSQVALGSQARQAPLSPPQGGRLASFIGVIMILIGGHFRLTAAASLARLSSQAD